MRLKKSIVWVNKGLTEANLQKISIKFNENLVQVASLPHANVTFTMWRKLIWKISSSQKVSFVKNSEGIISDTPPGPHADTTGSNFSPDSMWEVVLRVGHLHLQALAHVLDEVRSLLPVWFLLVCGHCLPSAWGLCEQFLRKIPSLRPCTRHRAGLPQTTGSENCSLPAGQADCRRLIGRCNLTFESYWSAQVWPAVIGWKLCTLAEARRLRSLSSPSAFNHTQWRNR